MLATSQSTCMYLTDQVFCAEMLLAMMLQSDNMVNKGQDIGRRLKRCMMTWKSEYFDVLLFDLNRCSKHHKKCSHMKSNEFHNANIFTHLLMKGQVRAAFHWISERTSKGVYWMHKAMLGVVPRLS